MKKMSTLQTWWKTHGQKIVIGLITLLIVVISFRFGQINAYNDTKIEVALHDIKNANPTEEEANLAINALKRQGINIHKEIKTDRETREDCLFVASRNSKKYHTKDCKYGKKIKDSNLICFKSTEEAQSKGYVPAKGCLGKKH